MRACVCVSSTMSRVYSVDGVEIGFYEFHERREDLPWLGNSAVIGRYIMFNPTDVVIVWPNKYGDPSTIQWNLSETDIPRLREQAYAGRWNCITTDPTQTETRDQNGALYSVTGMFHVERGVVILKRIEVSRVDAQTVGA
jgi:hypothetical protein